MKPDVILNQKTEELLINIYETENIVQKIEPFVVPPSVLDSNYEKKKADRAGFIVKGSIK